MVIFIVGIFALFEHHEIHHVKRHADYGRHGRHLRHTRLKKATQHHAPILDGVETTNLAPKVADGAHQAGVQ